MNEKEGKRKYQIWLHDLKEKKIMEKRKKKNIRFGYHNLKEKSERNRKRKNNERSDKKKSDFVTQI